MARPYIWRLIIFSRLICPSTCPVLHGDVTTGVLFNPLASCAACAFVVAGLGAPAWLATGGLVPVLESRPRPVALVVAAVLIVVNWAWLCASGV